MSAEHTGAPRVLVVEDDGFTRTTLCAALRGLGIDVVANTGSAAQALDLAARHTPDAALLDLDLGPGPGGIEVAIGLRGTLPQVGLVILTGYSDPRLTGRNVDALPGGTMFMTKGELTSADVLARAIRTSMRLAADPKASAVSVHPRPRGATARLTDTQVEVARMVADGLSNAEIAARRDVSPATVERIIQRIARELGIETTSTTNRRVMIAREFLRQGPPAG
ncbi:MAG: response regulator transcription factor [Actinomycetota bacterium]|nr:response regulator transcription factor [Actinomycetota bacterium]